VGGLRLPLLFRHIVYVCVCVYVHLFLYIARAKYVHIYIYCWLFLFFFQRGKTLEKTAFLVSSHVKSCLKVVVKLSQMRNYLSLSKRIDSLPPTIHIVTVTAYFPPSTYALRPPSISEESSHLHYPCNTTSPLYFLWAHTLLKYTILFPPHITGYHLSLETIISPNIPFKIYIYAFIYISSILYIYIFIIYMRLSIYHYILNMADYYLSAFIEQLI